MFITFSPLMTNGRALTHPQLTYVISVTTWSLKEGARFSPGNSVHWNFLKPIHHSILVHSALEGSSDRSNPVELHLPPFLH